MIELAAAGAAKWSQTKLSAPRLLRAIFVITPLVNAHRDDGLNGEPLSRGARSNCYSCHVVNPALVSPTRFGLSLAKSNLDLESNGGEYKADASISTLGAIARRDLRRAPANGQEGRLLINISGAKLKIACTHRYHATPTYRER
ncbi:unnamed protein product, partial [Iphiclides podalirius]